MIVIYKLSKLLLESQQMSFSLLSTIFESLILYNWIFDVWKIEIELGII